MSRRSTTVTVGWYSTWRKAMDAAEGFHESFRRRRQDPTALPRPQAVPQARRETTLVRPARHLISHCEGATIMALERVTLHDLGTLVRTGKKIPDLDRVMWIIGRNIPDHPIYLHGYATSRDPKDLSRSEYSGGMSYEATRSKGIVFYRPAWEQVNTGAAARLHDSNGCPSCRNPKDRANLKPEERAAAIKKCKDRQTYVQHQVFKVTWKQLATFLDPALDEQACESLKDFLKRRYEMGKNRGAIYPPGSLTEEEKAAWWDKRRAHDDSFFKLETEGREMVADIWDRALGLAIYRRATKGIESAVA